MILVLLSRGLRPEAFWAGDPGGKLICARAAIGDPTHPMNVPLPRIGGEPVPDLLGPFFVSHGDHAHALTSPLFPIISAPALATFGMRGLYLLPAVSWLLTIWLAAQLSRAIDRTARPTFDAFVVAVGTPLLFYGLEFWEHAPAIALTTAGTVDALPGSSRRGLRSGALVGLAFLLRPESLWYALALVAAAKICGSSRPTASSLLLGFGLIQFPMIAYNLGHFGSPVGPHLRANAGAISVGWLSLRQSIAGLWFIDGATLLLPFLLLGIALVAVSNGRPLPRRVGRGLILITTALLVWGAAFRKFPREGGWATLPFAGLVCLQPPGRDTTDHVDDLPPRFLRWTTVAFLLLVWLTAPNDGGAQWGPRYLLPASVSLGLLASQSLRRLLTNTRSRWPSAVYISLLLLGCLWLQRSMYRDLRIAKSIYANMLTRLAAAAQETPYILSDMPWLDILAASQRSAHTFLYISSPSQATAALARLQRAGERHVLVVRQFGANSMHELERWTSGSCYRPATSSIDLGAEFEAIALTCSISERPQREAAAADGPP
jgi:hypothetical protein